MSRSCPAIGGRYFEGAPRSGAAAPRAPLCSRLPSMVTVLVTALAIAVAALVFCDQAAAGAPGRAAAACKAPRELVRLTVPLTAANAAMTRDGDFRVIAIGSSSTQGAGASSPKMRYPAQLSLALNQRFHPDKNFEVVNLGVGGEMASDMLARIDSEVLSLKPDLVIWQTGVNDAIGGIPIDDFEMELSQGIDAIKSTGAELILLDLQYFPKSERVAGYKDYLRTMWRVAAEKGVPVLRRHDFMKHLVDSRQFTPAELLAPDLFHQNDVSYRCLGRFVADAIGDGLEQAARLSLRGKTVATR